MSLLNIFQVSGSAMTAQSMRLNVVASNLANAESVTTSTGQPYRARQVVFNAFAVNPAAPEAQGVQVAGVVESDAPGRRVYEPGHPAADADGYVTYPNVSVVEEMVNMISASRAYQDNVEAMNTARSLMARTLTLGN